MTVNLFRRLPVRASRSRCAPAAARCPLDRLSVAPYTRRTDASHRPDPRRARRRGDPDRRARAGRDARRREQGTTLLQRPPGRRRRGAARLVAVAAHRLRERARARSFTRAAAGSRSPSTARPPRTPPRSPSRAARPGRAGTDRRPRRARARAAACSSTRAPRAANQAVRQLYIVRDLESGPRRAPGHRPHADAPPPISWPPPAPPSTGWSRTSRLETPSAPRTKPDGGR